MAYVFDPFLEEQNKIAGLPSSQDMASIDMPSLQGAQKSDVVQNALNSGDNFMASLLAKKSQEAVNQRNQDNPDQYDPSGKTPEQVMAETGRQNELDQMRANPVVAQPTPQPETQSSQPTNQETVYSENLAGTKVEGVPEVTQAYGNKSSIEKYSGGVNLGTDFRASVGTELRAPEGNWVVETAAQGENQGSGNLVRIKNAETGETIAFEHLSTIGVKPGQVLKGGEVVALSGNTGNSTGPHASIPYRDAEGNYQDILSTPYATQIFGQPTPQDQTQQNQPPVYGPQGQESAQIYPETQYGPQPEVVGPSGPPITQPVTQPVTQPPQATGSGQLSTTSTLPVQQPDPYQGILTTDQPVPEQQPQEPGLIEKVADTVSETFNNFFGGEEQPPEVTQPTPSPEAEVQWKPAEDDYQKVQELNETAREPITQLLQKGSEATKDTPYEPFVFEGHRSEERQAELYAQGRTAPGQVVTNAKPGESNHNHGNAVDIYFRNRETKEVLSPDEALKLGLYDRVGKVGKEIGLTHGGTDWGWDHPHFEVAQ